MKFFRKLAVGCAAALMLAGTGTASVGSVHASSTSITTTKYKKTRSALVYDTKTKKILAGQNYKKQTAVASVAKLMTLYLVLQKLHNHKKWWNARVNTSYRGLKRMGVDYSVGGFAFKKNHYTVRQLFEAALIESSNNAAIALGQWVAGGSTPKANRKFVKMMNKAARKLKLKAHFVSASGLEQSDLKRFGYSIGGANANHMSAYDVLVVTQKILELDSSITKWSRKRHAKVAGQTLTNSNRMLKGGQYYRKDLPVFGLKTGYTSVAQNCLVALVHRKHNHMLITVTLHSLGRYYEYHDTQQLMRLGYRIVAKQTAAAKKAAQKAAAKKAAAQSSTALVTTGLMTVLQKGRQDASNLALKLERNLHQIKLTTHVSSTSSLALGKL